MGHPARRRRPPAGGGHVRREDLAIWRPAHASAPGESVGLGQWREFTPALAANQEPDAGHKRDARPDQMMALMDAPNHEMQRVRRAGQENRPAFLQHAP
jgi:hypothetical protein